MYGCQTLNFKMRHSILWWVRGEIILILNPIQCCCCESPVSDIIMSHFNQVHILMTYFSEICLNIISSCLFFYLFCITSVNSSRNPDLFYWGMLLALFYVRISWASTSPWQNIFRHTTWAVVLTSWIVCWFSVLLTLVVSVVYVVA